jgi:putative effector of murein hydrolase
MIPKSVTTPIAVEIVGQMGGSRELCATLVVVTGLFGAVVGPRFLRLLGVRDDLSVGLAMGTAAHGIGTASALRHSELRGTMAGLAMALNGILTSVLMIPLYKVLSGTRP